jgi:hypothetical protein
VLRSSTIPSFFSRIQRGDAEATKTFTDLNTMIAGASRVDMAMAGVLPGGDLGETLTPENPTSVRVMATVATGLREQGFDEVSVRQSLEGPKSSVSLYRQAKNYMAAVFSDPALSAKVTSGDFEESRRFSAMSQILGGEVISDPEYEAYFNGLVAPHVGGR